jgi:SAM-dependent methyltransferase
MNDLAAPAPDAHPGNADQAAYWNDRAAITWTAMQERLDANFTPITAAALAAAAPQHGERVLDIGCGCGETVLELARAVGPSGRVTGADISVPMLERARARAAEAGLTNTELLVADAQTHAFAPGAADLLFSRFGVMFFADPPAAFANLRRAMRPGGRLLFACWRPMTENSWFTVPLEAARHLLPPQPPADPLAPGPFAFADPDRVRGVLADAGWQAIGIARHDAAMRIAGPGEIAPATEFATRVGILARLLAEESEEVRAAVREVVAAALAPHDGPGGVVLGGSVWLVSATA